MDCLQKYTDQGFYIFPCWLDKTPLTKRGFYDAVNDFETIKKQFFKPELLIGLPTGKKNEIVVIDFDVNKKIPGTEDIDTRSVDELIEEVKENHGELPDTFQVQTPSGGRHFYYLLPENAEIRSKTRFIDKFLPVDIRGDGGYCVTVDNNKYIVYDDVDDLGIDNIKGRCAPLPEWIVNFTKIKSNASEETLTNILPEEEIREIRSALAYLSSDDRDTWVRIGMALKSTNSPSAYGLWNEWSKTSDKYKPDDMENRWNGLKPADITIASLFHEAQRAGWITTYEHKYNKKEEKNDKQIIVLPTLPDIETLTKMKEPFPSDLLKTGGIVGNIIDFIMDRAIIPQPIFALSAALCAVGTLAGRKYQTSTGIRTNIYCLNIGGSGSGKEAPRKAVKDLFEESGCGNMACVEDIASDSAIVTALTTAESQLFLLDEVGRFLETTKKGATHLFNVVSVLLKLYSSADQIYYGKIYASEDKRVKIIQPNLCLLGSTVPDTLYKGLNYEAATDGFLSRMLIFETDENIVRKQRNKKFLKKPSAELVSQIKALKRKPINHSPDGDVDGALNPKPLVVEMDEDAHNLIIEFDEHLFNFRNELREKGKAESTYNRSAQLAEQIALILSIGNNVDNPVITREEMLYSIKLSKYLSDNMQYIVENYMAKNDYEHEVKRILRLIQESGYIALSEISRKTQNLPGHIRNDVLETLQQSKQIEERLVGKGIYAHKVFVAI
jgi:hypothetical protein